MVLNKIDEHNIDFFFRIESIRMEIEKLMKWDLMQPHTREDQKKAINLMYDWVNDHLLPRLTREITKEYADVPRIRDSELPLH
jgi:hypothetical protein